MRFLFIVLLIKLITFCDTVENGWKGIKPGRSNLEEVTKILGIGRIDGDGFYHFETEDALIYMNFSTEPCVGANYGRGQYNVPEKTVLTYSVIPKRQMKLSTLKLDSETYRRDTSGDVIDTAAYISNKKGIWIDVGIRNGVEYVGRISYRASESDMENFKCPKKVSGAQFENLPKIFDPKTIPRQQPFNTNYGRYGVVHEVYREVKRTYLPHRPANVVQ